MVSVFQFTAKYFIFLTWVSIVVLFIDGANLTDIYSDSIAIHFDECTSLSDSESPQDTNTNSSGINYDPANQSLDDNHIIFKHIIFDQDSPSLAASQLLNHESCDVFSNQKCVWYQDLNLGFNRYLRNRTLLI
ncbi:MAG: hypothetical protein ACHQQQ_02900 [Bacteroidota bacterium]